MISARRCAPALIYAFAITAPAPAMAQGVGVQIGRLFDDGGWTAYSAAWTRSLVGPVGWQVGGVYLHQPGSTARLFGATLDASLFRGGRAGVYGIGGIGGGFGSGSAESWWRSWSAGIGYELIPLPYLSLGIEGRYREMLPSRRSGPELAIRLGTLFGPRSPPSTLPIAAEPATAPVALSTAAGTSVVERDDAAAVVRDVIRIAEGEIGTRYQLGGKGEAGDGFDCSGLIQYAYARYGIELPRRSADQALRGRELGRDANELRAGDILTFSTGGGRRVTHVGLYMGDGRFIHSASRGVQVSRLDPEDRYGRWWHRRWVGTRRIIETPG
jgi:cell wall-associated NlpC family hydrolase